MEENDYSYNLHCSCSLKEATSIRKIFPMSHLEMGRENLRARTSWMLKEEQYQNESV